MANNCEGHPGHTEGHGLRRGDGPGGGSSLLVFVFTVKEAKSCECKGRCWQGKESVWWDSDPTRDVCLWAPGQGPSGLWAYTECHHPGHGCRHGG